MFFGNLIIKNTHYGNSAFIKAYGLFTKTIIHQIHVGATRALLKNEQLQSHKMNAVEDLKPAGGSKYYQ